MRSAGSSPLEPACVPAAGLIACLLVVGTVVLPRLPNHAGLMGADYSIWLPNLLAGDFWHQQNSLASVPWFNPAQCAGSPLHADPQGAYLSLPQFLTFLISPLRAVQLSVLLYASGGFLGTYILAVARFGCSRVAGLLAATLFTLNGFYSARMMVGHLSFAPFMLVPAMAACLTGPPGTPQRRTWRAEACNCLCFAALLSVTLQAGMAVLILPAFLCLAIIVGMHALFAQSHEPGGVLLAACRRAALGSALGLAICAGKLAAVLALMAHIPRDSYPLPGLPDAATAAWMAIRCVFLWPEAAMTHSLVNAPLLFELHEFDYRVGPVPPLLFAAAAWMAWRRRDGTPTQLRTRLLWEGLALLLLLPVALNTYAPGWTAFLKHVPVLRSASSQLRFFAAYMLPAALGAGLALDALTRGRHSRRRLLAGTGIALTGLCALTGDHSAYGAGGIGVYDPAPIEASWQAVATSRQVPPIRALADRLDASGHRDPSLGRQNLLTEGLSPLFCYDALFGYRLEAFRQGGLHDGPVLDQTRIGGTTELNLKNPACYVFPGANGCLPGDNFRATDIRQAIDFAAYRPFAFAKPWWAHAADTLGMISAAGWLFACFALSLSLAFSGKRARA